MTRLLLLLVICCCISLPCCGFRAIPTHLGSGNRYLNTATVGGSRTQCKLETHHYPKWQLNSNGNSEIAEQSSDSPNRKIAYLVLWVGLIVYAFGFSPGGSASAAEIDNKIIMSIISTPFDGTVSPLFVIIFNLLGLYPLIYASLLLSASKSQRIPALPFVAGSLALGFFGIGPYLGLREYKTDVTNEERGRGSGIFESKLVMALVSIGTLGLLQYTILNKFDGETFNSYLELFKTQRLVHISTIDFVILTLALWDPLKEDMIRRDWRGPSALTVCALPIIGPLSYLLFRDKLPSNREG